MVLIAADRLRVAADRSRTARQLIFNAAGGGVVLKDVLAITLSALAFALSLLTLWLTVWRRGRLLVTHPSVVYLAHESSGSYSPKVFLRTALFATGKRGIVIESLFVKVHQVEALHYFTVWAHGERTALSPGGGLYIGETGIIHNHHFALTPGTRFFEFSPGSYTIELYARVLNRRQPVLLTSLGIAVTPEVSDALATFASGACFFWAPEGGHYRVEVRPLQDLAIQSAT